MLSLGVMPDCQFKRSVHGKVPVNSAKEQLSLEVVQRGTWKFSQARWLVDTAASSWK